MYIVFYSINVLGIVSSRGIPASTGLASSSASSLWVDQVFSTCMPCPLPKQRARFVTALCIPNWSVWSFFAAKIKLVLFCYQSKIDRHDRYMQFRWWPAFPEPLCTILSVRPAVAYGNGFTVFVKLQSRTLRGSIPFSAAQMQPCIEGSSPPDAFPPVPFAWGSKHPADPSWGTSGLVGPGEPCFPF